MIFYDFEYENIDCFVCGKRFLHKKDMVSHMDKYMSTWRPRTLFRNNNLAATFVVMSDEARTGGSATWKCAQRMGQLGRAKLKVPLL